MKKASLGRAFVEAGLPAWVLLSLALVLGRGNTGSLGLLPVLFPGIWGAFRLRAPAGGWLKRTGIYALFCVALALSIEAVMVLAVLALRALGLFAGTSATSPAQLLAVLAAAIGLPFLVVRLLAALPGAVRRRGWKGLLLRAGGGMMILAAAGAGSLAWISQPYSGHAGSQAPAAVQAVPLFPGEGADWHVWSTPDEAVRLEAGQDGLSIRWQALPRGSFSLERSLPAGGLPDLDGLRLRWSSPSTGGYLAVRVETALGEWYEAEANLPLVKAPASDLVHFLPSLERRETGDRIPWEQAARLSVLFYPDPGTGSRGGQIRLDAIEGIRLAVNGGEAWQVLNGEHTIVRCHAEDRAAAESALQAVDASWQQVTGLLGSEPPGRVPVTIAATHAEMETLLGGAPLARWTAGGSLRGSVVALTSRRLSPWFNGHTPNDLDRIAVHEAAHLLVNRVIGYQAMFTTPLWLHEGLATYLAGQEAGAGQGARRGGLRDLAELDGLFQTAPQEAYPLAESAVETLVQTAGEGRIASLLHALGAGLPFEQAFASVVGKPLGVFGEEWIRTLPE